MKNEIEYYVDCDPGIKSNPRTALRTILIASLVVEAIVIGMFILGFILDLLD